MADGRQALIRECIGSNAAHSELICHDKCQKMSLPVGRCGFKLLPYAFIIFVISLLLAAIPPVKAEANVLGYVPYWNGGALGGNYGPNFSPAPWPGDSSWMAYTWENASINDPRVLDPSNGGTRPQNYVNVSSGCPDQSLPSIYIDYDPAYQMFFFRWRVEQIPNTYATGPAPSAFSDVDPWKSAQWTVLMDTDGDGYREFGMQLDGSTGMPAYPVDILRTVYSNTLSQNMDPHDRDIFELWHNPTAFVNDGTAPGPSGLILNFHNSNSPDAYWPNGSAETVWDYGTTRSVDISDYDPLLAPPAHQCSQDNENEYFVDYEIPLGMLSNGTYSFDCTNPTGLFFSTANSLTNPFQKDVVANESLLATPDACVPFGDLVVLCGPNGPEIVPQPVVDSVTASPAGCTTGLTAQVRGAITNTACNTNVTAANFYYYYDANGNGLADDGSSWVLIGAGTQSATDPRQWTYSWNTAGSGLQAGSYLIGVVATNNIGYHTWSFLQSVQAGDTLPDGTTASSTDKVNPDPTPGIVYGSSLSNNSCGETVVVDKTANPGRVATGQNVQFTVTVHNNTSNTVQVNNVTDYLPTVAGSSPAQYFTYVSTNGGTLAPGTPAVSTNTVTWTFSPAKTISAGGTGTIVFTAQAPNTAGTYENTCGSNVNVASWGQTTNISCNYVQIGVGAPDLTIAKSASVATQAPGGNITYTITYSNNSPANVTGVYITDVLPSGLTFVSASNGGTYNATTKMITWNVGNLQSDSGPFTVSFMAQVTSPYPQLAPTKLLNTATIYSNETAPKSANVTIIVTGVAAPLLTIQKNGDKIFIDPTIQQGTTANVTYTIAFSNVGDASAAGTTITDPVPVGWTYVSSAAGTNCPAGTTSGNPVTSVTWNIGTLAPNASGVCNLVLRALDSQSQPYAGDNPSTNTASIQATNFAPPASSSYSVGLTGSTMTCQGQTYYFHNKFLNVGFDGSQEIANTTAAGSGPSALHHVYLTSNGCSSPTNPLTLVADFYQDPPLVNNGSSTPLTAQWYTEKTNGNPTTMYASVYDYDPASGAKTLLGQETVNYTGADQTPQLNQMTVTPTSAPQAGHRLYWRFEACTNTNNQVLDLTYYYDGIFTTSNGKQVPTPSHFCYQGTSVVMNKTVDKISAVPGDTLTYSINFGNNGGSDVTGSQITDTLPAGVTFATASLNGGPTSPSPCTQSGQVLTCPVSSNDNPTMGTITAGQQGTLVVTVTVQNPFPSGIYTLVNTSQLTTNQTQPITSSATTAVATNVAIMKSVDKTILYPGDTATYTLKVLNSSGSATTVNVTDALPIGAYYSYVVGSATNGGIYNSGTITWTNLSVPAYSSVSLTFQMNVSLTGVPLGTTYKDNTGIVAYGAQQYSNTVRVTILNGPNLNITKTVFPAGPVAAGANVTWSMTVANVGSQDALGVVVTDPVPTYMSYKKGTIVYQAAGQTDANDGDNAYFDAVLNRIVYAVGTLPGKATRAMSFNVTVNKPMPAGTTTVTNTATASSINTATKQASASINVTDTPAFILDKSAPSLVAYGNPFPTFIYSFYYKNTGGSNATNVVVTDVLPAGLGFISADNGGTFNAGTRTVTWSLGTLAPGTEGALHLTVQPSACGSYNNTATIVSTEIPGGVVSNSGAPISTAVCALVPDKSTSTPNVTNSTTGTTATYTLTVTNPAATPATGVQVTDNFASGFTYASTTSMSLTGTGSQRTATVDPAAGANHPTWGAWTIGPQGVLSIQFVANVDGSVPAGTYQNNVSCTSTNANCLAFDELSTTAEDVTVAVPVDISVVKTVDNAAPSGTGASAELVYTITLTNVGTNHAFKVDLSDLLPSEVTYVSNNPSQGTYDNNTGVWNVGRIDRDATATLTINVYPNDGTGGTAIQNCATLSNSIPVDVNPSNDQSCTTVTPTEVSLAGFDAYVQGGKVVVEWETVSERNTVGFYLYRYDANTRRYVKVDKYLLPGFLTSGAGGTYRLIDQSAVPSGKQLYKIVEVQNKGGSLVYGPFTVDLGGSSAGDIVKRFASDGTLEITIKGDVATKVRNAASTPDSDFLQVTDTFSRKVRGMSAAAASRLAAAKQEQANTRALKQTRKGSAIKIPVPGDGIYYLDASDISAKLNMPLQSVEQMIKTGNLALSCSDGQVSYTPSNGDAGLFFFGKGINNVYTDENIYWLNAAKGSLMNSVKGGKAVLAGAVQDSFADTIHMEQDLMPAPGITTDPDSDYWFWDYVMADTPGLDTKDFNFKAYSVSTGAHTAAITVRLYGITSTGVNPEHHAVISLNGVNIAEGRWSGISPYSVVANIDQSLIRQGDNVLEVKAVLDSNVPYSLFMIDSFDVTYARRYEAVNDYLRFKAGGSSSITVAGFSTPSIAVFNITDPLKPEVVAPASTGGQAGNYSVKFYPDSANAVYVAFTPAAVITGKTVAALPSADLKRKKKAADYIVIAPEELKDAAQMLADYRQSKTMTTMVVSLESIMDEFNYGMYDPGAIKSFLQYAYNNWKKKPSYAVLVGAGTYDYKNVMGFGGNLIPPLMVGTPWGLVPSDNVLGDFNGDNVPEIAVGRIPVVSNDEMQTVLDKIKSFEGDRIDGVMMLADSPDGAGNFPKDSNDIAQIFAAHLVEEIYLSDYQLDQARSLLFDGLNRGMQFVNYMGHAGIDQLTQNGLLTVDDVAGLSNGRYPVLIGLTCMVGQYAFPGFESLTDALIVKNGGGIVSSWAPSGFSLNADAKILGQGFYTAAFQPGVITLGDAVIKAMAGYQAQGRPSFILNSFNIIGDPALSIK